MKQYLQALYQSFGNPALYARVIHVWRGSGFAYLLLLGALIAVLMAGQFSVAIYRFNRDELPHIITQLPAIAIKNGEITVTSGNTPSVIRNMKNDILAVIDPTKTDTDLMQERGAMIVGKNFILLRQADNNLHRVDLSEFGQTDITVNRDSIKRFFDQLRYLAFLLTPLLMLMQWLTLIALSVIAASLSYVVTAYMPEEYNFETRMRMGAIAITPPLIIDKLLQLATPYHLGFWIILAVWVLHLYVMVVATRHYVRRHDIIA